MCFYHGANVLCCAVGYIAVRLHGYQIFCCCFLKFSIKIYESSFTKVLSTRITGQQRLRQIINLKYWQGFCGEGEHKINEQGNASIYFIGKNECVPNWEDHNICKFRNFREDFIFAKLLICDLQKFGKIKSSRNGETILPFTNVGKFVLSREFDDRYSNLFLNAYINLHAHAEYLKMIEVYSPLGIWHVFLYSINTNIHHFRSMKYRQYA